MTSNPKQPRLYLQAGATDLSIASEHVQAGAAHGLVLTGSEAASVRSLRAALPGVPLVIDAGRWKNSVANAERPLDLLDQNGLFGYTLENYVDELVQSDATEVLPPSLAIRKLDWDTAVPAAFRVMDGCTHSAFRPHLALQNTVLDASNLDAFIRTLKAFGRPIDLTLLGAADSLAARGQDRLLSLRILVEEGLVRGVLATEPLVATDGLARGLEMASIGLSSSLRIPQVPGGHAPQSPGWQPGVFHRDILEIRSPAVFAAWYIGRPDAPLCPMCGCLLTRYHAGLHALFVQHTVHAASTFGMDLLALDPTVRRAWLAQERALALSRHPLAAVQSAPSKILKQLIVLDGLESTFEDAPVPAP